jgi:uncharacterized protein with von Willebrand factor type A (vWA) domain
MLEARCLDADPEAFFPEKGGSTREAKRICAACPVRDECLQYALDERRALRDLGRPVRARASPREARRHRTRRTTERLTHAPDDPPGARSRSSGRSRQDPLRARC